MEELLTADEGSQGEIRAGSRYSIYGSNFLSGKSCQVVEKLLLNCKADHWPKVAYSVGRSTRFLHSKIVEIEPKCQNGHTKQPKHPCNARARGNGTLSSKQLKIEEVPQKIIGVTSESSRKRYSSFGHWVLQDVHQLLQDQVFPKHDSWSHRYNDSDANRNFKEQEYVDLPLQSSTEHAQSVPRYYLRARDWITQ